MTKQDLIKSYGKFYHITCKANQKSIEEKGLEPKEKETLTEIIKIICFTIQMGINEMKGTLKDKCEEREEELIVYEISADILSKKDIRFDLSFSDSCNFLLLPEVEGLKKCIEVYKTLACYDPVPFAELAQIR